MLLTNRSRLLKKILYRGRFISVTSLLKVVSHQRLFKAHLAAFLMTQQKLVDNICRFDCHI